MRSIHVTWHARWDVSPQKWHGQKSMGMFQALMFFCFVSMVHMEANAQTFGEWVQQTGWWNALCNDSKKSSDSKAFAITVFVGWTMAGWLKNRKHYGRIRSPFLFSNPKESQWKPISFFSCKKISSAKLIWFPWVFGVTPNLKAAEVERLGGKEVGVHQTWSFAGWPEAEDGVFLWEKGIWGMSFVCLKMA